VEEAAAAAGNLAQQARCVSQAMAVFKLRQLPHSARSSRPLGGQPSRPPESSKPRLQLHA